VAQVLLCTINPVNTDSSSQGYNEAAGVSRFKKVTNGRPFLRRVTCFSYSSRFVLFHTYCHYCILLYPSAVKLSSGRTAMNSSQPSDVSWTSPMEHPCPGQVNISLHANPTAMDPDASCCLQSTQNAGQDLRSTQGCKTSQNSIELRNCCGWKRRWRSWAEIFAYSSALFARRRNPNIATSDTTKLQYILRVSHSL